MAISPMPLAGAEINEHLPASLLDQLSSAFPGGNQPPDRAQRLELLRRLHSYYVAYMAGPEEFTAIPELNADPELRAIEASWLAWEDQQNSAVPLPGSGDEFLAWFREIAARHVQPAFCRYLAEEATLSEL